MCRSIVPYRAGGKVFLSVFEKLKKIDSNDRKELKKLVCGKEGKNNKKLVETCHVKSMSRLILVALPHVV